MPLPDFVNALQRWSVPQNKDWFGYKESTAEACAVVAASLHTRRRLPFEVDDVFLTNGAFAAIAVALSAVVDPGDEVIFISPPWFFCEALIAAAGATPVRVKMDARMFDLDLDAIAGAITERTRALIINSPHNPTGKIYPPTTLQALACLLDNESERRGRTIYLLSDEAYSRIVYDGREYHSPTEFYPDTFLLYTYGKTLLTPGQRLGYIALLVTTAAPFASVSSKPENTSRARWRNKRTASDSLNAASVSAFQTAGSSGTANDGTRQRCSCPEPSGWVLVARIVTRGHFVRMVSASVAHMARRCS